MTEDAIAELIYLALHAGQYAPSWKTALDREPVRRAARAIRLAGAL